MTKPLVFISYAQFDDEFEGGALRRFRDGLSKTLRFISGGDVTIFQEGTDVEIGQQTQQRISQSLSEAMVLVPMITPSYFTDQTCRTILDQFLERERQLGRNDLVLAVYYQHVAALDNAQQTDDSLLRAIAQRRMLDWQSLRGKEFSDLQVRAELKRLAERIIAILAELKAVQQAGATAPSPDAPDIHPGQQQAPVPVQQPAPVTSEQRDLLGALVQAARSLPRDRRQPFTFASMRGNGQVVSSFVEHPGLSPEHIPVYRGDIEELIAAGFLRQNSLQDGPYTTVLEFDITQRGFNHCDQQVGASQSAPSASASAAEQQHPQPMALKDMVSHLEPMSEAEFDRFCLMHVPDVYRQFGRSQGQDVKINLLLEHCQRKPDEHARVAELLNT